MGFTFYARGCICRVRETAEGTMRMAVNVGPNTVFQVTISDTFLSQKKAENLARIALKKRIAEIKPEVWAHIMKKKEQWLAVGAAV